MKTELERKGAAPTQQGRTTPAGERREQRDVAQPTDEDGQDHKDDLTEDSANAGFINKVEEELENRTEEAPKVWSNMNSRHNVTDDGAEGHGQACDYVGREEQNKKMSREESGQDIEDEVSEEHEMPNKEGGQDCCGHATEEQQRKITGGKGVCDLGINLTSLQSGEVVISQYSENIFSAGIHACDKHLKVEII